MNISTIVITIIVIIGALLFIIIPLAMFLTAIFEKMNIRQLQPLSVDKEQVLINKNKKLLSEAISNNFRSCGYYTDGDKGITEAYISLSISEDKRTLLWIQEGLARRYKFISQMGNEQFIITSNVMATIDLSDLEIEEMFPAPDLSDVYQYHLERLMRSGRYIKEIEETHLIDWLDYYKREKVRRMILLGYARFIDSNENRFKYTLNGAIQIAKYQMFVTSTIFNQQKLVESRAKTVQSKKKY